MNTFIEWVKDFFKLEDNSVENTEPDFSDPKCELEYQFNIVKENLSPSANVYESIKEFKKLLCMFYKYLEDKNDDSKPLPG